MDDLFLSVQQLVNLLDAHVSNHVHSAKFVDRVPQWLRKERNSFLIVRSPTRQQQVTFMASWRVAHTARGPSVRQRTDGLARGD